MRSPVANSFFRRRHVNEADELDPQIVGEVREFIGNGTQELSVPGLQEVKYVSVGGFVHPLVHMHTYPIDNQNTTTEAIPVFAVEELETGEVVLLKNQMYNYGVWQDGARVMVGGEWDDAVPAVAPAPASKSGLAADGTIDDDAAAEKLLALLEEQQKDEFAAKTAALAAEEDAKKTGK